MLFQQAFFAEQKNIFHHVAMTVVNQSVRRSNLQPNRNSSQNLSCVILSVQFQHVYVNQVMYAIQRANVFVLKRVVSIDIKVLIIDENQQMIFELKNNFSISHLW